jgi:hypothetical protein
MKIEDIKQVQRLVDHLALIRKSRTFLLMHENAMAGMIDLEAKISESAVPQSVLQENSQPGTRSSFHSNGRTFEKEKSGWIEKLAVRSGEFSPERSSFDNNEGHFRTLSARVMDGVRAAVNDEIEATEQAIRDLGFEVPGEE